MISPEKIALIGLQDKLNKIARDAMDALRHSAEASAEMLPHLGHKTNADAVLSSYKYYRKEMDAAIKEHLKQYPD